MRMLDSLRECARKTFTDLMKVSAQTVTYVWWVRWSTITLLQTMRKKILLSAITGSAAIEKESRHNMMLGKWQGFTERKYNFNFWTVDERSWKRHLLHHVGVWRAFIFLMLYNLFWLVLMSILLLFIICEIRSLTMVSRTTLANARGKMAPTSLNILNGSCDAEKWI